MIVHVVLFRPKPTLTADEREALVAALGHAIVGIPSIRRARIGRRIRLNRPGYETAMVEHYEYSAILEFDSEPDLRAYLEHPSHVELGRRLFASADGVLAYDFEYVDPDRLSAGG
ncbi:MAG TPA: Dabb family protein [Vicinamibacterales bacterium]|nr:Dabb family protein [Vicinamibacterales bacterium]